jgi:hypothetical protein
MRKSKTSASGAAAGDGAMPKSAIPNMQRVLPRDANGNVPLGNNQYGGPSSITDVTKTPAMDGLNTQARGQDGDDVIDIVKAKGMGSNFQTRSITATPYPTSHSMKNPNASPARVPLATDRGRR